MSAAATAPAPTNQPSRSGRLLSIIRRLIDYGRQLATTIQQRAATDPDHTRSCFGTTDLALILRAIARGLLRANALEARVLQRAACLDKEPRPHGTRPHAAPSATRPAEPAEPPLAPVPGPDPKISLLTPDSIAAEIRRRPIGAVLADICRDFGILPSHPLMRELQQAIRRHGGSAARLLIDMFDRYRLVPRPASPPAGSPEPALAPAGTGPP